MSTPTIKKISQTEAKQGYARTFANTVDRLRKEAADEATKLYKDAAAVIVGDLMAMGCKC